MDYKKQMVKSFLVELSKAKDQTSDSIEAFFKGLAAILFNQIDILAGKNRYSFAEIEFYYYNKDHQLVGGQYKDTYKREKPAGCLFWHLSGIDICFDSDGKSHYGGILIRSLVKDDGSLITGPMCCCDELMNSCVGTGKNETPAIIPILVDKEIESDIIVPIPAKRQGIKADEEQNALPFCFYTERSSWKNHKGYNYAACPEKRKIENNDNRRTDQ